MTSDVVIAEEELIVRVVGAMGRLTLNRPRAINALTLGMIRDIDAALTEWETDDSVRVVLLDGAGERGFCAGGDIKALWESAKSDPSIAAEYWREEYLLDARIASYPKPVVALMDGLVMGGGVGLAAHARHRVATDRLKLAMPEVGIGFTPDVGGTWLLSRAPGELGTHMALTGGVIGAQDALLVDFADAVIPSDAVVAFVEELRTGDVEGALTFASASVAPDLGHSKLAAAREWIDAAYAHDTVEEIVAALRARPEPDAQATAEEIVTKSPTSLKVALRAVREAEELESLEQCLDAEFRAACAFLVPDGDFVEGIRAAVIDKDRTPAWKPDTLEAVTQAQVDRHFAPLQGIEELGLGAST
ncbi:MAG: enoyl-CoA hydratase/isomerase family protein [Thermoleophilia bacterium]|nr:enoyl-CoA hydratase/isomerase family protein [Thermoleophilia bacterium]